MPICEQCKQAFSADQGLLQDSDYMCGECVAQHIKKWKQIKAQGLANVLRTHQHHPIRHAKNTPLAHAA